jgi:hypothetical protein
VNFPNLTSIVTDYYNDNGAFHSCISLSDISMPCVNYIGKGTFYNCISLSSINLSLVSIIGSYAFGDCTSLKCVYTPKVENLQYQAFSGCTNLEVISLPNVSFLGSLAFYECTKLRSIYLLGSYVPRSGSSTVFAYCPIASISYLGEYGSIFVRYSLLSAWREKSYFSAYSSRFVGLTDWQIEELDEAHKNDWPLNILNQESTTATTT